LKARAVVAVVLGAIFIFAGSMHFAHTEFYLRMMPPYIPAHLLLVQISGVCEILGGIGLIVPRTRWIAAIGLIALLIAVFPANIQMALHPDLYRDIGPPAAFFIRLPLQLVAIYLVWWSARVITSSTEKKMADAI
jgi:uncharacterized membrane protein